MKNFKIYLLLITNLVFSYATNAAKDRGQDQVFTEGFCDVKYTVTKTGTTKNIEIINCSHENFSKATLGAIAKYQYNPKIVDGEPVEVKNVNVRVQFELENKAQKHLDEIDDSYEPPVHEPPTNQ